jgi:hypothetical protein
VLKPKLGPQCPWRQSLLQLSRELSKNLQILAWLWRIRMRPEKLNLDFIIRHASGKKLSEEEIVEAKQYAWELKYPKGALV